MAHTQNLRLSIKLWGVRSISWAVVLLPGISSTTYCIIPTPILDEDIETKVIVRLCKHAPLKHIYRFQHLYVFLAYGLMTLLMLVGDFIKLFKYHKRGMVEKKQVRIGASI